MGRLAKAAPSTALLTDQTVLVPWVQMTLTFLTLTKILATTTEQFACFSPAGWAEDACMRGKWKPEDLFGPTLIEPFETVSKFSWIRRNSNRNPDETEVQYLGSNRETVSSRERKARRALDLTCASFSHKKESKTSDRSLNATKYRFSTYGSSQIIRFSKNKRVTSTQERSNHANPDRTRGKENLPPPLSPTDLLFSSSAPRVCNRVQGRSLGKVMYLILSLQAPSFCPFSMRVPNSKSTVICR